MGDLGFDAGLRKRWIMDMLCGVLRSQSERKTSRGKGGRIFYSTIAATTNLLPNRSSETSFSFSSWNTESAEGGRGERKGKGKGGGGETEKSDVNTQADIDGHYAHKSTC